MPDIRLSESQRVQTAAEILPDRTAIELARDPAHPERLHLVHWLDDVLQIKPEISHMGRIYAPSAVHKRVLRTLRLPTRVAPPETTRDLFAAVIYCPKRE